MLKMISELIWMITIFIMWLPFCKHPCQCEFSVSYICCKLLFMLCRFVCFSVRIINDVLNLWVSLAILPLNLWIRAIFWFWKMFWYIQMFLLFSLQKISRAHLTTKAGKRKMPWRMPTCQHLRNIQVHLLLYPQFPRLPRKKIIKKR